VKGWTLGIGGSSGLRPQRDRSRQSTSASGAVEIAHHDAAMVTPMPPYNKFELNHPIINEIEGLVVLL
jgi:hypothetical protein